VAVTPCLRRMRTISPHRPYPSSNVSATTRHPRPPRETTRLCGLSVRSAGRARRGCRRTRSAGWRCSRSRGASGRCGRRLLRRLWRGGWSATDGVGLAVGGDVGATVVASGRASVTVIATVGCARPPRRGEGADGRRGLLGSDIARRATRHRDHRERAGAREDGERDHQDTSQRAAARMVSVIRRCTVRLAGVSGARRHARCPPLDARAGYRSAAVDPSVGAKHSGGLATRSKRERLPTLARGTTLSPVGFGSRAMSAA
jgi:hypothetical protein